MYTGRNLPIHFIIRFAWKPLLCFSIYGIICVCLYELFHFHFLALPFTPIALVGTAVAFYVGFKNNSSYERLWEARKIWGSIVNISRSFTVLLLDFMKPTEDMDDESLRDHKRIIVHRHLAYINALRIQLRQKQTWEIKGDPFTTIVTQDTPFVNQNLLAEIKHFLHADEAGPLYDRTNTATHILRKQNDHITFLASKGCVDSFKQVQLGNIIASLYDQQGACERVKSYPFPRQYAHFSEAFVWMLAAVLPFGLIGELAKYGGDSWVWLAIPMSVIVSWIFYVMELIGDRSENPFENGVNDIPMTAICRTIEIDLREILGETDIPPKVQPVNNIVM